MALYMGQAVPESFTVQLTNAYYQGGGREATGQIVLNMLASRGVTSPEDAFRIGQQEAVGNLDPQMISTIQDPMTASVEVVPQATTSSLSNFRYPVADFGTITGFTDLGTPILPGITPLVGTPNTVPGGFPNTTTGLPSTGIDWLDGLINFGAGFIPQLQQPRQLPMPGGGAGQPPALPPAGGRLPTPGGRTPRGITINVGGRARTITAGTMAKIIAAAAALGITAEQYITQFGVPASPKRMNVLNPRALSRAVRRANGFVSFAKRTVQLTTCNRFKVGGKKTKKRACR